MPSAKTLEFSAAVVRWQKRHGRHSLPWNAERDPYKIWVSETMLQQTQAAAVIPYYQKFIRRFPTAAKLARARPDSAMAMWSGLGYYARARRLHSAANIIVKNGIPHSAEEWQKLPGIGKSTAAAIAVFSREERAAILDGNVKRVLARFFAMELPMDSSAGEKELWRLAESLLPAKKHIRAYTQGMMDLGATVCIRGRPQCAVCPLAGQCAGRRKGIAESLPKRRAKKIKPQKTAWMAMAVCGGRVFLPKRPTEGIWGGLRSFPEASSAADLKKQCPAAKNLTPQRCDEFLHEFSHYRLRAKVLLFRPSPKTNSSASGGDWIPLRRLSSIPLPSPIKKHIAKIAAAL